MKIALERMRSRVEETASGVRIVIPSLGSWSLVIFLSVWLCGWTIGEIFAAKALWFGVPSAKGPPGFFLVVWLALWTVGGAGALYTWLWTIAGREIVALDGATLSIAREPIPFPSRREFDWSAVRNLRVSPLFRASNRRSPLGAGTIAFDYGPRTFRFGSNLDEAEAAMLIDAIGRRFPVSS